MIYRCVQCGKRISKTDGGRCTEHKRKYTSYRKNKSKQYGHHWRELSKRFLRQYPLCALCGKAATISDHIKPLHDDSTLDDIMSTDNLAPVCHTCHDWKTRNIDRGNESLEQYTETVKQHKQRLDDECSIR